LWWSLRVFFVKPRSLFGNFSPLKLWYKNGKIFSYLYIYLYWQKIDLNRSMWKKMKIRKKIPGFAWWKKNQSDSIGISFSGLEVKDLIWKTMCRSRDTKTAVYTNHDHVDWQCQTYKKCSCLLFFYSKTSRWWDG